jgi:HAMP domain-containing protein/CheY-like chemotaxis protein
VAVQERRRKGQEPRPRSGKGAAETEVLTEAELQRLLEALRGATRGEVGTRIVTRKGGMYGELAQAFNELAETREKTTNELVRLSRVIGREGRLTERANVLGIEGSWKASLDSVNTMIDDLARPTTEVGRVIEAVAAGDLSQKIALKIDGQPVKGEFLRIGTTVNAMVDRLSSFADEVTRVAREVGTEGALGGQARVKGVSGTWKDLTDSVNTMADNLTKQVRNIAEVTTAVANGDLNQKVTIDAKGEVLELKNTINTMVDQLSSFADEVTRVAREAGTEGKLGGQAQVKGVSGTWKDLTDNVNFMVSNLTTQVRGIANVVTAVADGDLNRKFTIEARGEVAALADTVNAMIDRLRVFAAEVTRVAREVGSEGKLGGQAEVEGVSGTWRGLTESVNGMADNLSNQVRNIAEVTTAVAQGDLSRKITVDAKGEILALKNTINTMVDQLSSFADEVTRVAREVGTEGELGGQANVKGVSGTWKDLTDNVNFMATNLTTQVRGIAKVVTAVANGDLQQKFTIEARGEVAALADTINAMIDTLRVFADQVTGVAREVGTEGILGGQADVPNAAGTWKALTDNVNFMANNLTTQVRNIAEVTTAVANGDLSRKITVEAAGEVAELAETINTMVDQLSSFADEVTRVAREVGVEGRLGGQAQVEGVSGVWRGLTDNVNLMVYNLTDQVRDIAQSATSVAKGDLTRKVEADAVGEFLVLKNTFNTMVDQLSSFADEVTRVAREVGTEGQLGGQAQVEGVSGTWRGLTENVNFMASNLTTQVRNIAEVTTAVANGDLSRKITVEARGEVAELADTINAMVDRLNAFSSEVTRVAREVGTEGKLGGQANVEGVSGVWRDLTENVNTLADNLSNQVRNIADVTTAVANGDLRRKITVEARGEILELKNTINTMVDQLSSFADEVTRVAREVGTEGVLGGQADVRGVSGTWKDLTDSVNGMAGNLTSQVRNIAEVTTAVANGDLSRKITVDVRGEVLELKETINTMVDQLRAFSSEVTRVAREVGSEGILGGQARVEGVSGVWKDLTDNVNFMANNLTTQVRNIADVTTAVANGDLSRKITVEAAGEVAALAETINRMVDQLSSFADEVTRVAREVGTDGILGGQANVKGVSGTWKDLTDNVNTLADNLSSQVRNIADVTTAVALGDLSKKITVDVKGEVLELKNTINTMVDQLASFAAEVTRVAREVGTEGILGGQANVEGVSGVWRGLTDNVNTLAGTLTTQLRAIAEVTTAVTSGDLTRSIAVEAAGEVEELRDNINQMIMNLRETTDVNAQQDWLNTNTARFTGMLQGQRDLKTVSRLIMSELTPLVQAHHGAFFLMERPEGAAEEDGILRLIATYGYKERKNVTNRFKVGEALVGQSALEKKSILISEAPNDYIRISSGLGEAAPVNLIVLPVLFEDQVMAVVELGSFQAFSQIHQGFLEQLSETIGVVLNTIQANMRTEELLRQSQGLTQELQSQSEELQAQRDELERANRELEEQAKTLKASEELLQTQQEELQQTNEELEEKARLLADQNRQVEDKNREVESARLALEEKAEQLALSSKYKSEFLANMSHELRTPLNSLLILAKLLSENPEGNLTEKQVEFSNTIYAAGSDLLDLINDILDLSKVEAGKMDVTPSHVPLQGVRAYVERAFRPVAEQKGLEFEVSVADGTPETLETDEQRLQQILKNLLSNAFKFTDGGAVRLEIGEAAQGTAFATKELNDAGHVIAFAVRDTGIGIPQDKLRLIFEAFQQADGTTSRKYGGTGLGLSISREIARLLGGEIRVDSTIGEGSLFTLYLPDTFPERMRDLGESTFEDDLSAALVPLAGAESTNGDAPASTAVVAASATATLEPEVDDELLQAQPVDDDRGEIEVGDRTVLIVEDDEAYARTVLETARGGGFKGIVALRGDAGLALARAYQPDAIILDVELPGMHGWKVLDRLKSSPETRHIPVHVVTAGDDGRQQALLAGAVAFMEKPVTPETLGEVFTGVADFIARRAKSLLVVEDDDEQRKAIVELIGGGDDVEITAVGTSEEALVALEEGRFDCMVLDLKLPKTTGFDLLEKVKQDERWKNLPIIIYTGKDLTRREETRLKRYAQTIIVKDVRSPERLLEETALFLHRVESNLPQEKRRMLEQLHSAEAVFHGKKVLVVDDDVRNGFALASVLERQGMDIHFAENGREAIEALKTNPGVDLVLMDIMMPEMDGYETIAAIRAMPQFEKLPIISLTAKAMKGDREKSIASGASDYITKPVDTDQLLSLMRVWLYR